MEGTLGMSGEVIRKWWSDLYQVTGDQFEALCQTHGEVRDQIWTESIWLRCTRGCGPLRIGPVDIIAYVECIHTAVRKMSSDLFHEFIDAPRVRLIGPILPNIKGLFPMGFCFSAGSNTDLYESTIPLQ